MTIREFYKKHRNAIWRYGSALAFVGVAWLLDLPREMCLVPFVFGVVNFHPDDWGNTIPSFEEWSAVSPLGQGGAGPAIYASYVEYYNARHPGSSTTHVGEEPTMGGDFSFGVNINQMSEAGQNAMQTFLREVPGGREFMEFYLPHIQAQMEEQPQAYPPGFDLGAGENEQQLMQAQMDRLGQVPDIAKAYEGAFDAYLPMLEREYSQSVEETQGRLEALGLSGSSPGLEILSDMGAEHAAQVSGLKKDLDIQRAQAKTEMFNLEGTQLGAAWDMSGREAQRSYDTQRMEYADWLRQTGQQTEVAAMLGTPTYNTMLGSLANVFNTGQSGAASLGSSSMAASSGMAQAQYAGQMGLYSQQLEQQFMAPYLAMANQPVEMSGGGGCC